MEKLQQSKSEQDTNEIKGILLGILMMLVAVAVIHFYEYVIWGMPFLAIPIWIFFYKIDKH